MTLPSNGTITFTNAILGAMGMNIEMASKRVARYDGQRRAHTTQATPSEWSEDATQVNTIACKWQWSMHRKTCLWFVVSWASCQPSLTLSKPLKSLSSLSPVAALTPSNSEPKKSSSSSTCENPSDVLKPTFVKLHFLDSGNPRNHQKPIIPKTSSTYWNR